MTVQKVTSFSVNAKKSQFWTFFILNLARIPKNWKKFNNAVLFTSAMCRALEKSVFKELGAVGKISSLKKKLSLVCLQAVSNRFLLIHPIFANEKLSNYSRLRLQQLSFKGDLIDNFYAT